MSIITEALKRAEREREERELKMKQISALQEMTTILVEEEKTVESFPEKLKGSETQSIQPESSGVDFSRVFPSSFSEPQKTAVIVGALILSFFVLYLLSHWPSVGKNFSLVWHLSKNSKAFQIGPIGILPGNAAYKAETGTGTGFFVYAPRLPFVLSGISILGEDRYAVINGRIVQKGDSIDGAFVKEILDREVVLETRGGEIKLRIRS